MTIYGSYGRFRFRPQNLPENTEIQMKSVELQTDLRLIVDGRQFLDSSK